MREGERGGGGGGEREGGRKREADFFSVSLSESNLICELLLQ